VHPSLQFFSTGAVSLSSSARREREREREREKGGIGEWWYDEGEAQSLAQ
jgi:hypothetical protein